MQFTLTKNICYLKIYIELIENDDGKIDGGKYIRWLKIYLLKMPITSAKNFSNSVKIMQIFHSF